MRQGLTPDQELERLLTAGSALAADQLNAGLRVTWSPLRAPQRTHSVTALVALFRRAGYVSDVLPEPSEAVMVYRGELVGDDDPGISWTADLAIARRYAQGYATVGDTRVMQATAPPVAILARFRQDAEVVVAPELLSDAELLGYIPHFQLPLVR